MIFYILLIILLSLDLLTKYLTELYLQNKINILWDFLYLQFLQNPWIAFWIEINTFFLKIITIILILCIFYYYIHEKKNIKTKLLDICFWLILAWAIWNAIGRILNSQVIDFILVKYFAVFNFADIYISIWWIIYLYILYKNNK